MIALRDAMNTMHSQDNNGNLEHFSLRVVTFNEELGTGGALLEIKDATVCDEGKRNSPSLSQKIINEVNAVARKKKNPNHYDNLTINIRVMPGGNVRKIHPLLITDFNGEKVF